MTRTQIADLYPLSPMQQGLLFHTLASPGSTLYVEQVSWLFRGELDAHLFAQAWQNAIDRHPVLRTGFLWEEADNPLQVVFHEASLPLQEQDWRALSAADQQSRLERMLEGERRRGFDLTAAPLMRLVLTRLADNVVHTTWTFHHLVLDGWSVSLLLAEVFAGFHALRAGHASVAPPAAPYRDFIAWLQQQDSDAAEKFWRTRLQGFTTPTALPVGSVGAVKAEPVEHASSLSETATEALQAFARRERVTLNTMVQGAWAILLSRYSGEPEVVFGSTVSLRPPTLANVNGTLGLMINTLPMRVDVSGDATLGNWLRDLQAQQVEARRHAFSPLAQIQRWSDVAHDQPLFETLLVLENYPLQGLTRELGDMLLSAEDFASFTHTNYPLNIVALPGRQLALRLVYDPARFEPRTIDRLAGHLRTLLEGMADTAGQPLPALAMLTPPERRQILVQWNETKTLYDLNRTIPELFEAQVARTPDGLAVASEDQQLSYAELNARANQVAHYLRSRGVGPGSIVAVLLDRSPLLVVGALGAMKAGAAYLPLDPAYPSERLAFMLEDAHALVLLTEESLRQTVPSPACDVLFLDTDTAILASESSGDLDARAAASDLAYVIYTSGSTGKPKAVELRHSGLVNLAVWHQHEYQVTPADRATQLAGLAFDASVWELWPYLTAGASIHFPDAAVRAEVARLVQWLIAQRITLSFLPTPLAELAIEEAWPADCALRFMLTGGDTLRRPLTRALPFVLVNHYGPTENTVVATAIRVPIGRAGDPAPAIGFPIANTTAYILDHYQQPVPVGVPGELYVGGVQVARGYLGRAELTSERFVPDPFSSERGARLYRTGDLARYRADGAIEFLGRLDHQVKVRGFRIELGEIEATLSEHPDVRAGVVVAREERPGEKRLVAYLVVRERSAFVVDDLRGYLKQRLPEYMVPSSFITLDSLPVNQNGKLDRAALPLPELVTPATAVAYVAPRTPTESVLAAIFSQVLGIDQVSIHDDFFELGGDSILSMQIAARAHQSGYDLPLRRLFEGGSVAELARFVEFVRTTAEGQDEVPLVPVSRSGSLPLSFAQQRMWVLDQLQPNSPRYNHTVALALRGPLNVAALRTSLNALVQRHESLRTSFPSQAGQPVQHIVPTLELPLPCLDLTAMPAAEQAAAVQREVRSALLQPFDLRAAPLLRMRLLQLAPEEYRLLLSLHHIVSDGWSQGIIWHELTALYTAEVHKRDTDLPKLTIQYADYAVWQRAWLDGERLERQLRYWREHLAGAPTLLALPTDHPRPSVQSYHGDALRLQFSPELTRGLRRLAGETGTTLYMVLLAAFQTLLQRYTGQDDLLVASAIAGRPRPELENLIGFFANTLVLRGNLTGNPAFRELLERTRDTALEAYAHQDLPFEKLVHELQLSRDLSYHPLVQAALTLENAPVGSGTLPGVTVEPVQVPVETNKMDLVLALAERGEGLQGSLEYDRDLFERPTIQRMAAHLQVLLDGIVANPDLTLAELPLLTPAERQQVLVDWNQTHRSYPRNRTLPNLFAEQAGRTPDAPAIVFDDRELSYAEVDERSNQLAHHLRLLGVGPETLVGICAERSPELVVGVLGILKAGGAYVPLDPTYPPDRVAFMLEDARVAVLLTQGHLEPYLPPTSARLVRLDVDAIQWAEAPKTPPQVELSGHHLAYVIYTSGSTGRPKGVMIEHRAVANTAAGQVLPFGVGPGDRVLQFSSLSFDASVWEIIMTLLTGAALHMARAESLLPGSPLVKLLRERAITVATLPQSTLAVMPHVELPELRILVVAGEACPASIVAEWAPGRRLFNAYGPTESSICATMAECVPDDRPPPVGTPIANTRIYILDRFQQPVPVGVPGELYIGGAGLARGYLNRPELTTEKFVPDPFNPEPGARLYRTGDLASYRADGNIDFLGRVDQQVKIRGFRIELGEIETMLLQHPSVRETVVIAREAPSGDQRLVAYIVATDVPPTNELLRRHLKERLPEYMLPSAFVMLDAWPLTPNGKIDRQALPNPEAARPAPHGGYVAPRTFEEDAIAAIWSDTLQVQDVGLDDNFFDLGGNSLLAMTVHRRLEEVLAREIDVVDLFQHPTVSTLAQHLRGDAQPVLANAAHERAQRGREALGGFAPRSGTRTSGGR